MGKRRRGEAWHKHHFCDSTIFCAVASAVAPGIAVVAAATAVASSVVAVEKILLYKTFYPWSFEFRFALPRQTLVCDLSPRSRRLASALRAFAKGKSSSSSSSSWVAHACMYNGADFLV